MKTKALSPILILAIAALLWANPASAKSDKANQGGHDQDWGQTPPKAVAAGKPEMLDPYGHSKDDRMELYGNRGRPYEPIVVPPPPEPPPEPPPIVEPPEPPPPDNTDPPPEPPPTGTTDPPPEPPAAPAPDPVPEVPFQ